MILRKRIPWNQLKRSLNISINLLNRAKFTFKNTSTSTSDTTGNETVTLAGEVKKYDTAELFEEPELRQVVRDYGMPGGPTVKLADFAKECKEKKKHELKHAQEKAESG
ncbi:hypothetical protein RhiirA1_542228 [Rhizophagus irregularis]|uniref:Uncharacterized protein n=1 Tax=Rhizophagus irregularis TaxID=588596 RepID=A0A2N0QYL4_9GLOM|nr:hypothetical protein RhiirA1_542228 [Rhizophagus irregularis]